MKNFTELTVYGLLAFTLSICIIPLMTMVAQKFKLVDVPNARKVHQKAIPLIGGLAIGIIVALLGGLTSMKDVEEILPIIITSYIMLLVGTMDDKTDIKAIYKLGIQICISIIIASSGIRITSLYGLFGIYEIDVLAQYIITVLVIAAAVNAFNLIDGIDGLAGSVAGIGFILLLAIAVIEKNYGLMKLVMLFIGGIAAFLRYNFSKKNKVFLGNSGSLFLGYFLVSIGIYISKFDHPASGFPHGLFFLLFVFTIPMIDSVRVYADRVLQGKSPFNADKSHIHHYLLQLGISHKKITVLFVVMNISIFAAQYIFLKSFSIYTFLVSLIAFVAIFKCIKVLNFFTIWKTKVKELENNAQ
ncbi:glycosyltransferase family 4 protein [Chryseobacterium nepalense]|jgi:UDP-GlcNAc:undecaprenyl-phosphate GlcNAc-1-phosphate transferase|uniref:Undecaprenyl/decaprenyl-phosphate alpha-N-acetylglucosaminyl 1-phosphate transferase n=1 Tax=Chryseobacterium nepalense TaxID=1854498 RepID=A0ABY4K5R0_9FLAO|nr:MraY family glycosyltransferase [Chryseobacterium nepalense]MEC5174925.1 UDP-GlcNAc:undecaprenyl-phosphate GlcNAc-1-phosphate transferase [Chryseobacterium nepalense]UPQ76128.1 undecaprenyl/decaprenyl-phosphate alpha-N-acetylglucosaminyl 1-phosphate transferase [Chryseobacterium nepalense]